MMNDAQFETLYNEYKNLVYNLALGYTQNSSDAQDISQEVFVKIYQHFHRHDATRSSVSTWIYRITINHCLDHIKTRKTKKRFGFITGLFHSQTNEPLHDPPVFDHPGIKAEDKEDLERLFKLINELPDNQRTALILTKIEGRSQKETAVIMDLTPKAVESLLQRARQSLGKKIYPEE